MAFPEIFCSIRALSLGGQLLHREPTERREYFLLQSLYSSSSTPFFLSLRSHICSLTLYSLFSCSIPSLPPILCSVLLFGGPVPPLTLRHTLAHWFASPLTHSLLLFIALGARLISESFRAVNLKKNALLQAHLLPGERSCWGLYISSSVCTNEILKESENHDPMTQRKFWGGSSDVLSLGRALRGQSRPDGRVAHAQTSYVSLLITLFAHLLPYVWTAFKNKKQSYLFLVVVLNWLRHLQGKWETWFLCSINFILQILRSVQCPCLKSMARRSRNHMLSSATSPRSSVSQHF